MKKITELTKEELISLLYNNFSIVNVHEEVCECAACGDTGAAQFFYVCDNCNKLLKDD